MPAMLHFAVKIISRAKGICSNSACAAAAYRSGEKIADEFDGRTHDFRRKQHVEFSTILLPKNAPPEYADRQKLWNAVELAEKQVNAQLAREIVISLPHELSADEQRRIVLEYIQETFVDQGMAADICFHNPPKTDSHKRPVDAEGHVTHDPDKMIFPNPHCHVMLTMRPIDIRGKWESKKTKMYVCEKDGEQRILSADDCKKYKEWEKLYSFKDEKGQKSWHTKSYAMDHPELTQINKYPKDVSIVNPIVEKWNAKESLISWRKAWADKINLAYAEHQIEAHVDHRSYADQGLDLIPTIHEGRAVTIAEKRLKEEYDRKIANGENAILEHTDVRNLNNAIREHNQEIIITQEIMTLRKRMEKLIAPVKERIASLGEGIAERLEHLRAEMISIKIKIKKAIGLKTEADQQIQMQRVYIHDLSSSRGSRLETLQDERKNLVCLMEGSKLIGKRRKTEMEQKLKSLEGEIRLLEENQMYANQAMKEIERLKIVSDQTGLEIRNLQDRFEDRMTRYSSLLGAITPEQAETIMRERLAIREKIEHEYIETSGKRAFQKEAEKFDREFGCIGDDQSREIALDRRIRYN